MKSMELTNWVYELSDGTIYYFGLSNLHTCKVRGIPFSWFWSTDFQNSKNLVKFKQNGVDSYKNCDFDSN